MNIAHPACPFDLKSKFKNLPELEHYCQVKFGLRFSQVLGYQKRSTSFTRKLNSIPILDQDEIIQGLSLGMFYHENFVETKDEIDYFQENIHTLHNRYQSVGISYLVGVEKSTVKKLIENGKINSPLIIGHDHYDLISSYSASPSIRESYAKNLNQTCLAADGHEEYVWVAFKANNKFSTSKEISIKFSLLGFEYFPRESQWRCFIHVYKLKHLLFLIQKLFPKHHKLVPLFFYNEAYSPKKVLSESDYEEYLVYAIRYLENLYGPSETGSYVEMANVSYWLLTSFLKSKGSSITLNISFDEILQYCTSFKNAQSDFTVFAYFDDEAHSHDLDEADRLDDNDSDTDNDPFTEEEWYNVENTWDK